MLSSSAANQNPGSSGVPRMQSSNNNGKGVGRSRPSHKGSGSNFGKGKGPKSKKDASAVHEPASSPASTDAISAIKSQLQELMGLLPIVKDIQTAFNACQEEKSRMEMAEDDTFILPAPDSVTQRPTMEWPTLTKWPAPALSQAKQFEKILQTV